MRLFVKNCDDKQHGVKCMYCSFIKIKSLLFKFISLTHILHEYMVNQRIGGEAVAAPLQACEFPEPVKQAGLQGAR